MGTENPWIDSGKSEHSPPTVKPQQQAGASRSPGATAARRVVRRLLNLPEEKNPTTPEPVERASERVGTGHQRGRAATPWQMEAEPAASLWWRRALRVTVYFAVVLLALIGLRELVVGDRVAAPTISSTAQVFPTEEASAVASRFARSYLTWDEDSPEARSAALRLDYAGGDDNAGWDGTGRQKVLDTVAQKVSVVDERRAVVTVLVLVQPARRTKGKRRTDDSTQSVEAGAASPLWRSLQVPVAIASDAGITRVVVTGLPGLVAVLDAPAADEPSFEADSTLTEETRDVGDAFFTAYAAGDVSAVVAPDAPVSAPQEGTLRFLGVTQWEVQEAANGGDERTAHALVQWKDPATRAELVQQYTLTLTPVRSSTGTRWQVNRLAGG